MLEWAGLWSLLHAGIGWSGCLFALLLVIQTFRIWARQRAGLLHTVITQIEQSLRFNILKSVLIIIVSNCNPWLKLCVWGPVLNVKKQQQPDYSTVMTGCYPQKSVFLKTWLVYKNLFHCGCISLKYICVLAQGLNRVVSAYLIQNGMCNRWHCFETR